MNKYLSPYTCHGVELVKSSGEEHIGRCPFCNRSGHFFVNETTGLYNCKKCGASGNVSTFLRKHSNTICKKETSVVDYKKLSRLRKLPVGILRRWSIGWDGEHWLLPVLSEKKTCRDVRRWNPKTKIMKSTTGCKVQIYGWYKAAAANVVWLCEGEWDAIAMSLVLNGSKERAVGIPGAMTFKDEWVKLFQNKTVYICYDNDAVGEQGSSMVYEKLKDVTSEIQILKWPSSFARKYDIRDFIVEQRAKRIKSKKILRQLKGFLCLPQERGFEIQEKEKELKHPPGLQKALKVFNRWLYMDPEMKLTLKIILAIALSTKEVGDPLWMYIIGPSGCGKTTLLNSLTSPTRIFVDNISEHTVVSGLRMNPDPSLLAKLNGDNKCCIWKDFTQVIQMREDVKSRIFSDLRAAYDGNVNRKFGNGVERNYDNLHFGMLLGVTPAIHGIKKAMFGERCLKLQMFKQGMPFIKDQIKAARKNVGKEKQRDKELREVVTQFLRRKVHKVRTPKWVEERLDALSELISRMRVTSERELFGEHDYMYLPVSGAGTRLSNQLTRLCKALAMVEGQDKITYEQYRLVERVAFDTADKRYSEIVKVISEAKTSIVTKEITEKIFISREGTKRQLQDLILLKVLERFEKSTGKVGQKTFEWRMSKSIEKLWKKAKIGKKPEF